MRCQPAEPVRSASLGFPNAGLTRVPTCAARLGEAIAEAEGRVDE